MKLPLKIRRRHHTPMMVAALAITAIALSLPSIQSNSNRWGRLTETIQRESEQTEQMQARQAALGERSKIADARLEGGCNVIPMVWDQPDKATVLAEGITIKNPDNNVAFPPGTIGCDPWGNTAILVSDGNGKTVVSDVASTTNFDLVKSALAKHGLVMGSGNPNVGASAGRAK